MKSYSRAALCAAISLSALATNAYAAPTGPAEPVDSVPQSTSANEAGQANDKQSLTSSDIIVTGSKTAQSAPITASLTTTQPQSAVSRDYIDNITPAADFNELIALTPGVSISGAGNGYGFGETKATIRGFQDGEYNVTYDSIPFGDTNNPTHHSTAFFPSNTIETVVVDRGPGNASQLGQASYGGNINMYSRAVKDTMGGQIEGILGNWNSFMGRAEFQSGKIDSLGGTRIVLTGQYMRSDGALTYSPVAGKNLYGKAVIPIGSANTLTVMSTWNRNFYYQSDVAKGATCGSTTAISSNAGKVATAIDGAGNQLTQLTGTNCAATSDIGLYGKNYGMTNNPALASYYKYNRTDKTTDFSYIRLQSELGSGFSMDNRAYMYGYTNNTMSGNGSTSVAIPTQPGNFTPVFTQNSGGVISGFSGAGTPASPYVAVKGPASDVLGYNKLNKYRVLGYIGQINYDFSMGKIRLGGWFEHAVTDRHLIDLDMTTGAPSFNEKFNNGNGTAAQNALPSTALANAQYLQHSKWNQYQLFGEFEFRPVESLSITPGVKYVHFTRSIDALVNQKSRAPLDTSATWTKALPFVTANWAVQTNWSFYAQYAQGMYVPDLSSFYSTSGSLSTALDALKPQTSTNYQVGTVWHGSKVSLDVDGYMVNVDNKIGTCTTAGCDTTLLINIGKVRYKGVEGQISYMPFHGLTLFANGSYNSAKSVTTGAQIAKAPFTTAAGGFIYRNGGFRLAFNQKYTGPQYANEFSGSPGYRLYRIKPYSVGDFAMSQEVAPHFQLGVTVQTRGPGSRWRAVAKSGGIEELRTRGERGQKTSLGTDHPHPATKAQSMPVSSPAPPRTPYRSAIRTATPCLARYARKSGDAFCRLAIIAMLASPTTAYANNYSESLAWQFRATADRVNQAAILDLIQKRAGGYYATPAYTTNIARQYNCSIAATSTGNSGSQAALANSPTVTGATSTAIGNENESNIGEDRSGTTVRAEQNNEGAVSSGLTGDTGATVRGTARQVLNSTQRNSGDQTASIRDGTACAFGALN